MSARIRRSRPAGLPFSPVLMRDDGKASTPDPRSNYYPDTYANTPTHLRLTPSGQIAWRQLPVTFKQKKNNGAQTSSSQHGTSKQQLRSSDMALILAPNKNSRPRVSSAIVTNSTPNLIRPQSSSFPTRNLPFSSFLVRQKIGMYTAADSRAESRLSTDAGDQQSEENELNCIFQELLLQHKVETNSPNESQQKQNDQEIVRGETLSTEDKPDLENESTNACEESTCDPNGNDASPEVIIPVYPNASFSKTSPPIIKQFLDSNFKLADSHASMLLESKTKSDLSRMNRRANSASPSKAKTRLRSAEKRPVDFDTLSLASTSMLMNLKSSSKPYYSRLYTGSTVIKPIMEDNDNNIKHSTINKQNGDFLRFSHSARLFNRDEKEVVSQQSKNIVSGPVAYSTNFSSPSGFYSFRYPVTQVVDNKFKNDDPRRYDCTLCMEHFSRY